MASSGWLRHDDKAPGEVELGVRKMQERRGDTRKKWGLVADEWSPIS
jgi:hypothetical protein